MRARGWLALGIGAAVLALALGYGLKDRCTRHVWDGYQYRTSCYNDVFSLYFFRGLDKRPFPYIHGDGTLDENEVGDLEYPALTGYYIGAMAELVDDGVAFFRANAAGLAAFGLAAVGFAGAVARDRRRLFFFALAPSLVLYAFHNWDLLALALMCAGLCAFHRRADAAAGIFLGLGAAAKVFPGLVLPALMLARRREDRTASWRMLAWAAGAFAAVNVPLVIANVEGWWVPWKFQGERFPNFETSWYMAYRHLGHLFGGFWWQTYPKLSSVVSGVLFVGGAALLVRAEARRERIRPYALSLGLLVLFLLTNKIFSPQYALWLLPFFVLVRMPWYAFGAFAITEASVWFAVSAYFLAFPPLNAGDQTWRLSILEVTVWVRYAMLGWLVWLSRRAEENVSGDGSMLAREDDLVVGVHPESA